MRKYLTVVRNMCAMYAQNSVSLPQIINISAQYMRNVCLNSVS
jgi:hypothetical protein